MAVCSIPLGSSLFPYCLIGCSIPVPLTALRHFSEVPSALLPSLFPSQQCQQFSDVGCFHTCGQTQHQRPSFFLKPNHHRIIEFRVTERLWWTSDLRPRSCLKIKLSQMLMSWCHELHGIYAVSPLSEWFNVVTGGQFDSWRVLPANSVLPPLLIFA